MVLNALVKNWLRNGGIVDFAVAVAAVSNNIHHNVAAKRRAILRCKFSDPHNRIGIFGVDVEDWNALPLGDIRSESRRMLLRGLRGESDEIVDDDMDSSTDGISLQVCEIDRFRQNTLARKRRITVHNDRPDFIERLSCAVNDRSI